MTGTFLSAVVHNICSYILWLSMGPTWVSTQGRIHFGQTSFFQRILNAIQRIQIQYVMASRPDLQELTYLCAEMAQVSWNKMYVRSMAHPFFYLSSSQAVRHFSSQKLNFPFFISFSDAILLPAVLVAARNFHSDSCILTILSMLCIKCQHFFILYLFIFCYVLMRGFTSQTLGTATISHRLFFSPGILF